MKSIPHLYEGEGLSFDDLLSVIVDLSIGGMPVHDKLDGQFIFMGMRDNQPVMARNKRHMTGGGLVQEQVIQEFEGHPLKEQILRCLEAFGKAAVNAPPEVFGEGKNFFLCEMISQDLRNVFPYETEKLVLHQNGHKRVAGDLVKELREPLAPSSLASVMTEGICDVNRPRRTSLDKPLMESYMHRLGEIRGSTPSEATVRDWMQDKISDRILADLPYIPRPAADLIAKKMLGDKVKLSVIGKWVDKDSAKDLLKRKKEYLDSARQPLQSLFRDFGRDLVNVNESSWLPGDSNHRVLESIVTEVIDFFDTHGSPEDKKEIDEALSRIGNTSHIPKHEGFVFEFNGEPFKLTGVFPDVNNLFWKKRKAIANTVGLYPGKFKPPHTGHWSQIQDLLSQGCQKVQVIVSPLSQGGFDAERSIRMLERMSQGNDQIEVLLSQSRSPIREMYRIIDEQGEKGTRYLVAFGEKDKDRYSKLHEWSKEKKKGVFVESFAGKTNEKLVTGTKMRKYLKEGNREAFMEGLPGHLNKEEKLSLWEIARS